MNNWNRTDLTVERLKAEGKLDADGKYQGRFIIHKDSQILGGVYLGQGKREAIVVDPKYGGLPKLYELAKRKSRELTADPETCDDFYWIDSATGKETYHPKAALMGTFAAVKETMPMQDDDAVREFLAKNNLNNDMKVTLDSFLSAGLGVCRHDALACGAVLEMFQTNGHLPGWKMSVDRNSNHLGGHAWTRAQNPDGTVYVVDVRQDFCGTIQLANPADRWAYERAEDF